MECHVTLMARNMLESGIKEDMMDTVSSRNVSSGIFLILIFVANGNTYKGIWTRGKLNGNGVQIWANGDKWYPFFVI